MDLINQKAELEKLPPAPDGYEYQIKDMNFSYDSDDFWKNTVTVHIDWILVKIPVLILTNKSKIT